MNEQFDSDLRGTVFSLCEQLGEYSQLQQDIFEQGRCEWQVEIEATAEIAALVEISLTGGMPDVVPFDSR